jgi:hypothetical protein
VTLRRLLAASGARRDCAEHQWQPGSLLELAGCGIVAVRRWSPWLTTHVRRPPAARRRRDLCGQILVYMLVGAVVVVAWAVIDVHGFFWPVFLVAGSGIGVVMNAWDACWQPQVTGQAGRRETGRQDKQDRPAPSARGSCLRVRPGPAQHRPVLAAAPGRWRSSCGHEEIGACPLPARGRGD